MSNYKTVFASLIALWVVGVAAVQSAHADAKMAVKYTTKASDPNNPKTKGEAPTIEATVIDGPNLTVDKFTLIDKSHKPQLEIKASKKVDFRNGTDTLAVAIVMLGWEGWIGNKSYRTEAQVDGVLNPLKTAIDTTFKDVGPPGSVGMLITYADTATVKVDWGPLGNLNGGSFGKEEDYKGGKAAEMVKGVQLAMANLKKVQNPQKVLIVITDGTDTNPGTAGPQLQQLKKDAALDDIQTFAIVFKTPESRETFGDGELISQMIPSPVSFDAAANVATAIQGIFARMQNRQYLTFPGYNKALGLGPKWDAKQHELAIKVGDKEETEPELVIMAPIWSPPSDSGFPWLIVIIISVVVLLLLIIMVKVFSKKPEPMPMPMPAPVAMAPMPEAPPKPLGPAKTVMIGQGGDEGGFPVVGWLVPLNGQNAYQTFRLRGGGTKIGTAPPADIVVNDGFMSTEHCQITCSPTGFSLIDPGSTNGCYVNDKRVQRAELVDNDMITLGKTNFKFKSIV